MITISLDVISARILSRITVLNETKTKLKENIETNFMNSFKFGMIETLYKVEYELSHLLVLYGNLPTTGKTQYIHEVIEEMKNDFINSKLRTFNTIPLHNESYLLEKEVKQELIKYLDSIIKGV